MQIYFYVYRHSQNTEIHLIIQINTKNLKYKHIANNEKIIINLDFFTIPYIKKVNH